MRKNTRNPDCQFATSTAAPAESLEDGSDHSCAWVAWWWRSWDSCLCRTHGLSPIRTFTILRQCRIARTLIRPSSPMSSGTSTAQLLRAARMDMGPFSCSVLRVPRVQVAMVGQHGNKSCCTALRACRAETEPIPIAR